MQCHVRVFLMLAVLCFAGLLLGGCVVAPPRTRVVAVAPAPARVWVPAYRVHGVWVRGHWRLR